MLGEETVGHQAAPADTQGQVPAPAGAAIHFFAGSLLIGVPKIGCVAPPPEIDWRPALAIGAGFSLMDAVLRYIGKRLKQRR